MKSDMTEKGRTVENVIVVYDYAFINGGAAKVAIQSAIGLSEKYHVCFFAAVGPVCDELKNSAIEVKCLNMLDINSGSRLRSAINGIWNTGVKKAFEGLLGEYKQSDTIVHIHGWVKALSASVVDASTRNGFKTIITLHDYFTLCPNGGFYNYQKNRICRNHGMSVNCFFCNCDKRSYMQKMWRNGRQLVQDYFVRRNKKLFFVSVSKQNRTLVEPWVRSKNFFSVQNPIKAVGGVVENIDRNHIYLYVGRISEEKGVELFCEAVIRLRDKGLKLQGVVVGEGPEQKTLKRSYKSIRFVGWKNQNEISEYMQAARALIFPSRWYEAAPTLTILEALSLGLPCIVSDCTPAVEIIREGFNGYVFESGNIDNLTHKMELCEKSRKMSTLSINAKKSFEDVNCSIFEHVANLEKAYKKIILK